MPMPDPTDPLPSPGEPGSDDVRADELPAPNTEDEQGVLDFLRGADHAGLTEVVGQYEMVGSLERQLAAAIAAATAKRAEVAAHEAEQLAVIRRLQEAVARLSGMLAAARVLALPALPPPDGEPAP